MTKVKVYLPMIAGGVSVLLAGTALGLVLMRDGSLNARPETAAGAQIDLAVPAAAKKPASAANPADAAGTPIQRMQLEAQYEGPLKDTVIQRWRDPANSMICYVYLPIVVAHLKPTPMGLVQYGANGIGSISCARPQ